MTLVQADGLCKNFGRFTAVDDISFAVQRGEVVGFLGPNGAGKSTTMKMLAGFLEPDAGRATLGGHDVLREPIAARRLLGFLPEGAPAYGDMSVADFLHFAARMRGLAGPRLRERVAEMVERVHLGPVWNRQIDNLSKGFKRRVGIAQALVHDPDVLILDEPTDGLDPNQKHEMRTLIASIAASKAIIISTHILEEVEAVCSRVIIIAAGRCLVDATPSALVAAQPRPVRIRLDIEAATPDQAVAHLRAQTGVDEVLTSPLPGGLMRLELQGDPAMASPAVLARSLEQQGVSVQGMGTVPPTLEDVFRAMTRAVPSREAA
ncbi:MAG: ABC transporter ATP-binding protein [Burkholderiaceae bacterium]